MSTPTCVVCAKSLPRGRKSCDANRQASFLEGSGKWIREKDDTGAMVPVYLGPKAIPAFPMTSDACVKDKTGLVISSDEKFRTTYDAIFGNTSNDDRPALGRCTRQHTFKDAKLPNGSPNPKPTVVETPAEWSFSSYREVKKRARAFGLCLRTQYGIGQKEKIAIWSGNCTEWLLADLSCAVYNWTSVSVYDTLGPNAASYIVADSGAKVLVCEDKTFKQVPSLLEDEIYAKNPGRDLQLVVCIGKVDAAAKEKLEKKGVKVVSFDDAMNSCLGEIKDDAGSQDTPPSPGDMCTIMYTSGTTGMPKGVMLLHSNIVATVSTMLKTQSLEITSSDIHLSYLPLAHIFERQNCVALLTSGAVVYMASNGAKCLLADLGVVRPTIFAGVPKVYENVRDAVKRKMTGIKKTLFEKAMAAKIADLDTGCGYSPLWDILVFSKTKKALGGRVRYCITGGAPISKETLQFVICALGPVVQGYGATETSAASTLTMSWDLNLGHVGPPIGNAAVRLVDVREMNYFNESADKYDDKAKAVHAAGKAKSGGEVWIGGPGVSPGYYDPSLHGLKRGLPSNGMAKKTSEDFFQEDGWNWFMTGDIGSWTERGCLKIVDRRKNMFKTSLGEYIPVEEVEKTYQDSCQYADFVFLPKETKVSYVAVCAVVSDSIGTVMKWAKDNGVSGDAAAVVASPQFHQLLFDEFSAAAKAKKLQRFMHIQNVKNIHAEYQPLGYQEEWVTGVKCANGHVEQLLTATFKARRSQLDQFFAPNFAKMYPDRPADHILP